VFNIQYSILLFSLFLPLSSFAQERTMGVFLNTEKAFNGYTLMSNNETTYLIDNCGYIVNTWKSQYRTGHGVYLLPNGDLLRAGLLADYFNAGGRGGVFECYDWGGNLKWQYEIASPNRQTHHDIAPLPNGNFLCTVWELKSEAEAKAQGRKYDGEVWSERILEIEIQPNNEAKIVWEWSIWDHLVQDHDTSKFNYNEVNEHPELLDINYIGKGQESSGNWLHVNAIDYNESLDQIVISSRNLNEIYVIDHSTTTAEAASHTGGKYSKGGDFLYRYGNPKVYRQGTEEDRQLRGQHDIRWIPKVLEYGGEFMVFNNEYVEGRQSRVQVFNNPAKEDGTYEYDESEGYGKDSLIRTYTMPNLYSDILSGAEIMPNGNWLILEGRSGHLLEINEREEMVWDYIYPVNRNGEPGIQGGSPRFNSLFRAKRYSPDYAAFEGKELLPRAPIELLPILGDCQITGTVSVEKDYEKGVRVVNTLFDDLLLIDNELDRAKIQLLLYHISGRLLLRQSLNQGRNEVLTMGLERGIYIALIIVDGHVIGRAKILKIGR